MTDTTCKETEGTLAPIQKIVDVFNSKDGIRYFRIQWKDTWEPEEHLISCQDELVQFWKKRKESTDPSEFKKEEIVTEEMMTRSTQTTHENTLCSNCIELQNKQYKDKEIQHEPTTEITSNDVSVQCSMILVEPLQNEVAQQETDPMRNKLHKESVNTTALQTLSGEQRAENIDTCEIGCGTEIFSRDYATQHEASVEVKGISIQVSPTLCSRGVQVTLTNINTKENLKNNSAENAFVNQALVDNACLTDSSPQMTLHLPSNETELQHNNTFPSQDINNEESDYLFTSQQQQLPGGVFLSENENVDRLNDTLLKTLETLDSQRQMHYYSDNVLNVLPIPQNSKKKVLSKKRTLKSDAPSTKITKRQKQDASLVIANNSKDVYGRSLFPSKNTSGSQGVLKLPSHILPNASLPLQAVNPHQPIVTVASMKDDLGNTTYVQTSSNGHFVALPCPPASLHMNNNNLSITHNVPPVSTIENPMYETQTIEQPATIVKTTNGCSEVLDESFVSTVYDPPPPPSVTPQRRKSAAAVIEEQKIHENFLSKYL